MRTEDLKTLSQLGQALWSQPRQSEQIAIETLLAVSTQELTSERAVEKTSIALLRRAQRDGSVATEKDVHNPFYRLLPEERFALMALHQGRWSYLKLSRVLGITGEEVERLAWASRLHLASMPGLQIMPHPNGTAGPSCPDYEVDRPWSQRFMDEELPKREQLFMQNHLMACDRCRLSLARCRALYYAVEKSLPPADGPEYQGGRLERFERALLQADDIRHPSMTFVRSMEIFLGRRDIQILLAISLSLLAYKLV